MDGDRILAHGRCRCCLARNDGSPVQLATLDGKLKPRILIAVETGDAVYTHGDRIGLDDGQFAIDIRDGIVLCLGAAHFHGILAQVGDRSSLGGEHWLLCERIERLTILEALVFSLEWRERVALLHGVLAAADGERRFFYCQRAANVCHIEVFHRALLDFDVILAHGRSRGGQAGKDGSSFQFAALDGILKGRILIAIETGDISDPHRDGIGSNDGQFAVDIGDVIVLRLGTAHHHVVGARN